MSIPIVLPIIIVLIMCVTIGIVYDLYFDHKVALKKLELEILKEKNK